MNSVIASIPRPRATKVPDRISPSVSEPTGWSGLAHLFKMLSDESRLRILATLFRGGEMHVSALARKLGIKQPALSHHLTFLRLAGIIGCRRDGKRNYYRLEAGPAADLLEPFFLAPGEGEFFVPGPHMIPSSRREFGEPVNC